MKFGNDGSSLHDMIDKSIDRAQAVKTPIDMEGVLRHEDRRLGRPFTPVRCPNDTNGDGDCGQFYCPWCGVA